MKAASLKENVTMEIPKLCKPGYLKIRKKTI